jgi:hypothetical protein
MGRNNMKKISDEEFSEYLTLTGEVEVIEDRLQTVAEVFMNEAQYLVGVGAKMSQVQRDLKARRAELYGEFRQLKVTDKSWTETAIESAINTDPSIVEIQAREANLEMAVSLRKYRVEALKILNGNLQILGRSILNEKFGVQ